MTFLNETHQTVNNFDINHVFVVNGGTYIPFRNISHVIDNGYVLIVMNNGKDIMINETEAWEFMQEYKGCVGLPLDGE